LRFLIHNQEWWKELWLNEGFATFIATLAANHFFPEWKYWTQFIADNIFPALDVWMFSVHQHFFFLSFHFFLSFFLFLAISIHT
jgi:hypothetical protein